MTVILNDTFNGVQKGYSKTVNNVKYGTALAATGAAYLAVDRDCYVAKKAGKVASYVGTKIGNLLKKTKIGTKVVEYAGKAKDFVKPAIDKVLRPVTSRIGNVYKSIKKSNIVQKAVSKIAPYVAKIPFKPVAAAAALITAAVLIHKHGRNSGKIDQRYDDKQMITNGFNIYYR